MENDLTSVTEAQAFQAWVPSSPVTRPLNYNFWQVYTRLHIIFLKAMDRPIWLSLFTLPYALLHIGNLCPH